MSMPENGTGGEQQIYSTGTSWTINVTQTRNGWFKMVFLQVFVGALSAQYEALSVEASKQTSSEEIVSCIADKLNLADASSGTYELAEVGIKFSIHICELYC